MKWHLSFAAIFLSSCATGQPVAWSEISSAKDAPQQMTVRGHIVHWSRAAHLLCPSSTPPHEPPFTNCIDLLGPDRLTAQSGCAVVSGTYQPYRFGKDFNIPSGYLMSKLGSLNARTIRDCGGR
jgi:hypothetical protein